MHVFLQHICFAVKFIIEVLIPDEPATVKLSKKRVSHEKRQRKLNIDEWWKHIVYIHVYVGLIFGVCRQFENSPFWADGLITICQGNCSALASENSLIGNRMQFGQHLNMDKVL